MPDLRMFSRGRCHISQLQSDKAIKSAPIFRKASASASLVVDFAKSSRSLVLSSRQTASFLKCDIQPDGEEDVIAKFSIEDWHKERLRDSHSCDGLK